MKAFHTYLNFDGNCREAMTFYAQCLDAELQVIPFSEGPFPATEETKNLTLHAKVMKGDLIIMASDCPPGTPLTQGNNFSISIACDSTAEVDKLFAALGKNGKVVMPAADMFWGAYFGMITDQFGINWMFNFEKTQQRS